MKKFFEGQTVYLESVDFNKKPYLSRGTIAGLSIEAGKYVVIKSYGTFENIEADKILTGSEARESPIPIK